MKKNDLFKELADMDIDKIAQEFPVLTDEEKERIFAMSERKYSTENSTDTDFINSDETVVSGVEQYKRPAWYKYASIAAAAVLTVGGISGSVMLMSRNRAAGPADEVPAETSTITEETTAVEETTETTTEAAAEESTEAVVFEEDSHEAIALDLTDRFADLANKLNGNIAYDPDDTLTFNIYTFSDPEQYGPGWSHFARVTEPRFRTKEDFLNAFREICTEDYFNALEEKGGNDYSPNSKYGVNLPPSEGYLSLDFSQYKDGDDIDMESFDWHTENFITYNGSLYVRTDYPIFDEPNYSDAPVITEDGDNSFTAMRCALFNPVCNASPSKVGNPLIINFEIEDGSWKISDILDNGNVELNAEAAVQYYFENTAPEYGVNTQIITFSDMDIIKHNYNYSFTVHGIIYSDDTDHHPILSFTADVTPKPDTEHLNGGLPNYHSPVGYEFANVVIDKIN